MTNKRYAQGMLKGCPDLFFPDLSLFIELKRRDGGVASAEQLAVRKKLRACGYRVEICHGAKAAYEVITETREEKEHD